MSDYWCLQLRNKAIVNESRIQVAKTGCTSLLHSTLPEIKLGHEGSNGVVEHINVFPWSLRSRAFNASMSTRLASGSWKPSDWNLSWRSTFCCESRNVATSRSSFSRQSLFLFNSHRAFAWKKQGFMFSLHIIAQEFEDCLIKAPALIKLTTLIPTFRPSLISAGKVWWRENSY